MPARKRAAISASARHEQGSGASEPAGDLTPHNVEWAGVSEVIRSAGARTPEELEVLLEDAVMIGDREALIELFEGTAVLVGDDGRSVHGREEVAGMALATLHGDQTYVADPWRVMQARDIALIVTERGINVARRDRSGAWHYAIVDLEPVDHEPGRRTP